MGREGQVASDVLELGLSTTQKTPMYGVVTISRSVMMHTVCIKQAKNKNVYNGMELKRLRKILSTLQNFTRNVFFCRLSTARCWRLASRTSAMGKATPLLFHIMVEYVPRLLSPESKKVAKSSRTVLCSFSRIHDKPNRRGLIVCVLESRVIKQDHFPPQGSYGPICK